MPYTMLPGARRPVKGPTLARLAAERPEPIDTAPPQPETSIVLFCSEQGGVAGRWMVDDGPAEMGGCARRGHKLKPTHWMAAPADPA